MGLVIDYAMVLDQMRRQELKCHYFNSGAFGFGESKATHIIGWIGPADPSIRDTMRLNVRSIKPPFEQNLTALFLRAWRDVLPGRLWLMPASHWAYELDFGNRDWLPAVLQSIGIDPSELQSRTDASAIEFTENDSEIAGLAVLSLLEHLKNSDFTLAFPNRNVLCSLHHHKQLWWTTDDPSLAESLRRIPTLVPK
jgi:hypothetical protein